MAPKEQRASFYFRVDGGRVARAKQQVRVLIAEDETIIRLDLRAQLEDLGYLLCAEARTGNEAVELEPEVAILDVKMPDGDGVEAARRILADRPIPILLLTAYSDSELVGRAARSGVFAYLVKPFQASELMPAIETAIARHRELDELRGEAASLAEALAARKSIERAKGLLMQREGLTEGDAFARLRGASQRSGQPMKLIADAIVAALS
jgi:two-component system, response regulator PdtaR